MIFLSISYRFFVVGPIRGNFYGFVPNFRQYEPTKSNVVFKIPAIKPVVLFFDVTDDAFHVASDYWGRVERKFALQFEVFHFFTCI